MKQLLNIGNVVDDGTGDYLREGGGKINAMADDTYGELGDGTNLHPAGAWEEVKSSASNVLNAKFGKSYAINTTSSKVEVKLPKGTPNDYRKTIKLRDTFATWQTNSVTVSPASGDTLKGSSESKEFNVNYTDLELVYCAPGRWEYLANKQINKISSSDIASVMKKEFLCTEGQTDFLSVFGDNDYNLVNTHVYHRGNLLYYGKDFSDESDYGSPGPGNTIVPLNGKDIRIRQPAKAGDSLMVVTYLDGIAQWRSTYNRLDCKILDKTLTNESSIAGAQLVVDLKTFNSITPTQLGYVLNSNSGLINPGTFEVYLNGVILNEAGKAGSPMFRCDGASSDNNNECVALGGTWVVSHTDYSFDVDDSGAIINILFDRKFEHGDVISIKWFNNNIGTTMEIDDIIAVTDEKYVGSGPIFDLSGTVRVTDFANPVLPNVEENGPVQIKVQVPTDMFNLLYPVGTIYENAINPNNPSSYMGFGVWTLWGESKVTVGWTSDNKDPQFGLNNNYKDVNGNPTHTAGGTGGNRTVIIDNDNLPVTETDEKVLVVDPNGNIIIGGCQFDPDDEGPAYNKYREERAKTNATHNPPVALDILPPYVTVYRWMRIA